MHPSQNSAKPERGIETEVTAFLNTSVPSQNSAKPERGIETPFRKDYIMQTLSRQNSAKPERGIETGCESSISSKLCSSEQR